MPWVPKEGALRRWRDFRQLTLKQLAQKSKVSERTIRHIESAAHKESVRGYIMERLAAGLSDPSSRNAEREKARVVCKPGYLAWWRKTDGTFEDLAGDDPTWKGKRKPKPPKAVRTATDPEPDEAVETSGPKKRTITERAEIERSVNLHAVMVPIEGGSYPLVGADRLQELDVAYADPDNAQQTFLLAGLIEDYAAIPVRAVGVLSADRGKGAAYFKVSRKIEGRDSEGFDRQAKFYVTAFAAKGEHGKELIRRHKARQPAVILARIFVGEPRKGETPAEDWKGFFIFETRPTPKSWAFVVDRVLSAEEMDAVLASCAMENGKVAGESPVTGGAE